MGTVGLVKSKSVFKLEDGLALYVYCINEGGHLCPGSFASKYRRSPVSMTRTATMMIQRVNRVLCKSVIIACAVIQFRGTR